MKSIYLIIPILLLAGCKRQSKNEIVLIGHLDKNVVREVYLKSDNISFSAPVDSSGTFTLKFNSDKPRAYQLFSKDELSLFLIPGDSIIINNTGEDLSFSGGQSALLSDYYQQWDKYWNKLTASFDEKKYFSREPDDFLRTVYAYIDTAEIPLKELGNRYANINPEFLRLEKERLKYWLIIDLLPYEYVRYKFYTGKDPAINESFHQYMNDVDLNDSSLLQLPDYKDFIISYVSNVTSKDQQKIGSLRGGKYAETQSVIDFALKTFKDKRVLEYVIFNVVYSATNNLSVNDSIFAVFKSHCSTTQYIDDVSRRFMELQSIMPGNPAPDFALSDVNHKEFRLSDFKGKYLLVDVWGIYCSPCIREIPKFNELKNKFKGSDISFVQVNLDATEELWKKKMKVLNMNGIQLLASNGWKSEFRKAYKIDVIPTVILIDREGKFIDARAPLPSENLESVLDKLPDIKDLPYIGRD
jgi:thiol-disulfide isomerase/thioredoxin